MVLRNPGVYSCDCALQLGGRKEIKVVLSEWVLLLEQFLGSLPDAVQGMVSVGEDVRQRGVGCQSAVSHESLI